MEKISKAEALRAVRNVGAMWGSGTSWTVSSPYHTGDVNGRVTETHLTSYADARAFLTRERARNALSLMGVDPEIVEMQIFEAPDRSLKGLVRHVAKARGAE